VQDVYEWIVEQQDNVKISCEGKQKKRLEQKSMDREKFALLSSLVLLSHHG